MAENPTPVADLFSIAGKVALVTGGSSGIGKMIATGYAAAGAKVYIASRKGEVCREVADELARFGEVVPLQTDLATEAGRDHLVSELTASESRLDILVNNAGAVWAAPLEEYPLDGFRKVSKLNVEALFFLSRELLPLLITAAKAEGPARVINIGSIDGIRVPEVDNFAYSAAKAAVHQLTRVLATKLGPQNITVNAIAPGPFASRMTKWWLNHHQSEIEAHCPLGRIGCPDDMMGISIYLASRAGAYVSGAVIPVDGGISLGSGL